MMKISQICEICWSLIFHPETLNELISVGKSFDICRRLPAFHSIYSTNFHSSKIRSVSAPHLVIFLLFFFCFFLALSACEMVINARRGINGLRQTGGGGWPVAQWPLSLKLCWLHSRWLHQQHCSYAPCTTRLTLPRIWHTSWASSNKHPQQKSKNNTIIMFN